MIRTDGPLEVGGVKASGETFPLQIDNSGNLLVSSSGGGGGAVTIADGADVTQGAKADPAATDSTSSWTVIALLKGLYAKLAGTLTIGGTVTATGPLTDTQLRATAVPVSLASAPSTSVTQGTSPWVIAGAVTNAGTFAVQATQTTSPWIVAGGGTAGSAAAGVATIQGITSMTPVQVSQATGTNLHAVIDSGTITTVSAVTALTNALPAGSNVIGHVIADTGSTTAVTGNVTVVGTGTLAVQATLQTGANLVGYVGNKWTFGAKTTLTTTSFTSLTNGSGWQSASISSTARDYILRIQTKGQTSGVNYVDFYVAVSISSDSTFTDGATGSEGSFTAANRLNSRYLGSVKINAGTAAVQAAFNVSDVFPTLPGKFAFIAINNSGATMSTTAGDHIFDVEPVN